LSKNKVTALVLAAGQGKRMNMPVAKQFINLKGKPVIYYSLKALEASNVDEVILVTGSGQVDYCWNSIVKPNGFKKVAKIIEGGQERYDSVYKGLNNIDDARYVMIHDGARPFIQSRLINQVIEQVEICSACIVGVPVKDTIKVVDEEGQIISTPNRNTLWAAQTPQAFRYDLIKRAYDLMYQEDGMKHMTITDDAMLYETYIDQKVKVLPGDYSNIKLTTHEDLSIAEIIMEKVISHVNE